MCQTRATKRKASPDTSSPREKTKVSETGVPENTKEDLRTRVLKRNFKGDVEGPTKKREFGLGQGDKESASSSAASSNDPLEGFNTSETDVSKRGLQRKADPEGDGARKRKKRNLELNKAEEETTRDFTVDPLSK